MTTEPTTKPASSPQTHARITAAQITDIQASVSELGYNANASYVMLADLDGQDVAFWCRLGEIDSAMIAALSAGDFLASREIGQTLGGTGSTRMIIQEHDGHMVLIKQIPTGHLLLMVVGAGSSLGFARLALRRTCDEILSILNAPPIPFSRPAQVMEFERALTGSAT